MLNEPFDRARIRRRVAQKILGKKIYFTSAEDLILIKLVWYADSGSSRHWEDVESVLGVSGKRLNREYLKRWSKKLNVAKHLTKLLKNREI